MDNLLTFFLIFQICMSICVSILLGLKDIDIGLSLINIYVCGYENYYFSRDYNAAKNDLAHLKLLNPSEV